MGEKTVPCSGFYYSEGTAYKLDPLIFDPYKQVGRVFTDIHVKYIYL